jgi:DNA invertase Pin-like site-specific DNA recombinase
MNALLVDQINDLVKKAKHTAPIKAYSYVRFSTPDQMKGDSLRRQTEAAERYAKAHGLELDSSSWRDLGVSGFRGANTKGDNALGRFLEAVEAGVVPKGSFLLVENLDRLSREKARKALRTLEDIIEKGITVVTLMDGRRYTEEDLNDPTSLLIAVLTMIRAHEESATKSKRAKEAWKGKVAKAEQIRASARCSHWLKPTDDGKTFEAIPERAEVVRRIFRLAAEGVGRDSIAKRLNEERVPVFNPEARVWYGSYIFRILNNRATLGEFTASFREVVDGKRVNSPIRTIKDYYPAVVSKKLFEKVEAMARSNRNPRRGRHAASPLSNLFGGLGRCPKCGAVMTKVNKGGKNARWPYLICTNAKTGAALPDGGRCVYRSVSYPKVEAMFLEQAGDLIDSAPEESKRGKELQEQLAKTEAARSGVEDTLENLIAVSERTGASRPAALGSRIAELHEALDKLTAEEKRIREELSTMAPSVVAHRLKELRAALGREPMDKAAVNALLRVLFSSMAVDYDRGLLEFHWRHGGESSIFYAFPED